MALAILLTTVLTDAPTWVFAGLLIGWLLAWLYFFKKNSQKIRFFLPVLILIISIWGILQLTPVQNFLVGKVTKTLSKELHAKVKIQYINYHLFDKMALNDLLIEDLQKDTLLYAGSVSFKITDWFFFKNKAIIHYISLDDALVNLHRSDSVWNYQFLVDYFEKPADSSTSNKEGLSFDLKKIQFSNIQFKQVDKWIGQNMEFSVKTFELNAEEINLKKKQIHLQTITLDNPFFSQEDYTGYRPDSLIKKKVPNINLHQLPYKWNNEGWLLIVNNIEINNGVFKNEIETEHPASIGSFDGQHFQFSNITGEVKNIRYQRDTLSAFLQLSSKEKSGFELKRLQANVKFTPDIMEFKQLDLMTEKSRLGNYYAMKYTSFQKSMNNFIHDVQLEGKFIDSKLSSDDLAFFAPEVKDWKMLFNISGAVIGKIDNLRTKGMRITSGNSLIDGDISFIGLPDINKTFINLDADNIRTNYTDICNIIPSLKNITTPQLSKLGNVQYQGKFTGFINDFVAFGTINTQLGILKGDINLKLPENKTPVYRGKISTVGFKLGDFFNTTQLQEITFNGNVNGNGFSAKDINANFDGKIDTLGFNGYNYQHIDVNGNFFKKIFNGVLSIHDENLIVDSLKGTIDFNSKVPQFLFNASLEKADFKKLNFTKEDFDLKGQFELNFAGNNMDDFLGTAKVFNAKLTHNHLPLVFNSMLLQSSIEKNQKKLILHTNNIDAELAGTFSIKELPAAFKLFLKRYFPSQIDEQPVFKIDQNFTFTISTKVVDAFSKILDKRLGGFNNSLITGNLNLKENKLNVNAEIPLFSYDGKIFNNTRFTSSGNLDSLQTVVDIDEISINDSLRLPSSKLAFTSRNDISNISIKTKASKTFGDATINATLHTLKDGLKIHFFPSSFIINEKKWELEKDGELTLSTKEVSANEIKFMQGNQQIIISTEPSEIGNSNDLVVKLNKININDFVPFVLKEPNLEGHLTGNIRILDPFGKPSIEIDAKIKEFRLDGDSIGMVNGIGTYSSISGIAKFKLDAPNINNQFKIEGSFHTKDSSENQTNISIVSDKLDLAFLNSYLGSVFSNIKGIANTADLKIKGNGKNLSLTGTANITGGSMLVNYTKCKYLFGNETIIFNPDEIDFGKFLLRDTLNNTATLSGKMFHHFFQDFFFDDVKIETDKLLVLNTTKKDNSQFYGKVIGKAKMTINGPVDNMTMDISGEPSRMDTSHIYLLSGSSIESSTVDYIDFIQFGSKMEERFKGKSSTNILVNMILTANPSCKIDVILDEATGDIIKGEGNGLLKIRVGNKEPLTINGNYNITKGEYTFNFQTFLKKYFTVNSGSIVWSGDPVNARIDILAEYLANKVDFKPISTAGAQIYQKEDVRVIAHLTETLLKPAIDFEFKLPDASSLKSDFVINKRLQQFKDDKNELNKQVTSLLLFNSFVSSTQGLITANSGYNVLASTIGGVVSNALSGFFNKLLQKYIKNTSVYLDLNTGLGLESNVQKLQAAAKTGFVFTLLNGRVIISAGFNLDYNNPYVVNIGKNNNLMVTPDITAEWLLSKDGTIRLVGFNRTNFDLISQRTRTGISLSYRKDFDKLNPDYIAEEEKKKIQPIQKAE